MVILRLTLRQMWVRRGRTLLTLGAIALAVSLVVAVTSGFASLSAVAMRMVGKYQGTTDVFITAKDVQRTTFPASVVDELRADPRVSKVAGRFETSVPVLDLAGNPLLGWHTGLVGLNPARDENGASLTVVKGRWFTGPLGEEAVINDNLARLLKSPTSPMGGGAEGPTIDVGETITLPGPDGPLKLKVIGIVHQPEIAGMTAYVPLDTLRGWALKGKPAAYTRALVEVRKGDDLKAFGDEWTAKLKAQDPAIRVKLARENKKQIETNLSALSMVSSLAVSIALVAAACIVFSTLSMGVAERQRQLAMLRAIGASRGQVAWLVVLEGLALAVLGVGIGAPLGYGWTWGLTWKYSGFFTEGPVVSWSGVGYALLAAVATALVATILPAWQATRVSPLEAMGAMGSGGGAGGRWPWRSALCGAGLATLGVVNVVLVPVVVHFFSPGTSADVVRGIQFFGHVGVGVPTAMAGFFLMSPLVVRGLEAVLAPLAARVLKLPAAMVRQQLASGIWRAAGTVCALMVGLSTLVVIQVQGRSLLGAWRLPDKFPDMFILHRGLGGLTDAEVEKLANTPGIVKGDLMPIAIASPQFGNNFLAIAGAAFMPDATMFFGIDPEQANRMTELEFRQGDAETATRLIKQGRHVLVTEEFRQVKGLGVGDTLELKTRTKGLVKFTIAGVVWSPGIDVMVGVFDMGGQFDQRTAYSVFGSLEDARELFGVTELSVFAANVDRGVDREALTKTIQTELGKMGLQAFDIRQVKAGIEKGLGNLLIMASSVAFAALAVASLGVTNTVMASVRSRRWQFGVMRAVGVTRSQLVRLVLAEAVLLGAAAAALGLGCGAWLVMIARGMEKVMLGIRPEIVLPWGMLFLGVSVVVVVSVVASIWPAASTSRRPVLELLQAGRGG
jgi:putative ABC transport system permease protein